MKNFLRALRCSWPYRGRLIISILCAVFAAIFWGLTLGAVYPVLQGLMNGQSLHQWVKNKIERTRDEITEIKRGIQGLEQQVNNGKETRDRVQQESSNHKRAIDKEAEKRERA